MRQLFTEGRSKFQGEVFKSDFRLHAHHGAASAENLSRRPQRADASTRRRVADGVLTNYSPPEAIPPMVQHIAEGAKAAGRDPSAVDVGIYIRMCITEDEDKAVDSFRRELASYAFVDSYNKMFARYGLAQEFEEVRRLWKEGKREEAPSAISEASAAKSQSSERESRPRFRARYRAAGVTHPVVFPIGPPATTARDYPTTMRALAGA